MATNYERFVDTDAGASGDGSSGSPWNNLAAAFAAMGGTGQPPLNLTTLGDTYTIYCTGSTTDTTGVVTLDYVTSATSYIRVIGDGAGSAWDGTTKYRLSVTNTHALTFVNGTGDHLRFENLQLEVAAANANTFRVFTISTGNAACDIRFIRCHLRHEQTGTTYNGAIWVFGSGYAGSVAYIINCIATIRSTRDNSANAILSSLGAGTTYVYSSTGAGGKYVWRNGAATLECENTYGGNSITADFSTAATLNMRYCSSEDGTSGSSNGCRTDAFSASAGAYFTSVSAPYDFSTSSALSGLRDAGTDTTGESAPLNFTDDITGTTRTGTWDIGAWQYNEPPTGPTNIKTWNGLAQVNVKTVNGLAIDSVKSGLGLT